MRRPRRPSSAAGLAAAAAVVLPAAAGLQFGVSEILQTQTLAPEPLSAAPSGYALHQDHRSAVRLGGIDFNEHRGSAIALVLACALGTVAFRCGVPAKTERCHWTTLEHKWLAAAMAQVMVVAGTLAFVLIQFPGHALQEGLQLWQVGAVLGFVPVGHAFALPLYPHLLALLGSEGRICGGAALARGLLLIQFAHGRSFAALAVSRLLLGATCGLAQSALLGFLQAHWPRPEELTNLLAYEDSVLSLGSTLGCCLGAVLFMFGYTTPFWAAASLNCVLGALLLGALWAPAAQAEKAARPQEPGVADCLPGRKSCEDSLECRPACSAEPARPARGVEAWAAPRGGAPPCPWSRAWYAWPGMLSATLGVLLAAAAATFWEPLLSLHLYRVYPKLFASPMETGAAWAVMFAVHACLNVAVARNIALLPSRRYSGLWAATCGWTIMALGLSLAAMGRTNSPWLLVAGLTLFVAASVLLWVTSMPRLLEAAAPLGPALVQSIVPQVWFVAYGVGEAFGPLVATATSAGVGGIEAAAAVGAIVATTVAATLLAGGAGGSCMEWMIEGAIGSGKGEL